MWHLPCHKPQATEPRPQTQSCANRKFPARMPPSLKVWPQWNLGADSRQRMKSPNDGTTATFPPDVALPQRYLVARERVEGALALNDLTAVSGQHILAIYSS